MDRYEIRMECLRLAQAAELTKNAPTDKVVFRAEAYLKYMLPDQGAPIGASIGGAKTLNS